MAKATPPRLGICKFPDDYWNSPKRKPTGDADVGAIYHAVGAALSNWEVLEESMASLFSLFVDARNGIMAAQRAYGAIASSSGRADALEAAAEMFLAANGRPEPFVNEFKVIMNNYARSGARRNEIAHGIACGYRFDNVEIGYFHVAPDYNTRKTAPFFSIKEPTSESIRSNYAYTADQIHEIGMKFREFRTAVALFRQRMFEEFIWPKLSKTPR